ncbi:MAG: hypothetical protein ACXIT4_05260 [Erythrobacter sp.]
MSLAARPGFKGMPLMLFGLLMTGWTGARVLLWESPFPDLVTPSPQAGQPAPAAARLGAPVPAANREMAKVEETGRQAAIFAMPAMPDRQALPAAGAPNLAAAAPPRGARDDAVMQRGFTPISPPRSAPADPRTASAEVPVPAQGAGPLAAPFTPAARPERWSLDAWGFWRQGSDAAPISQGRVPIYGASQVGAIAQFRPFAQSPGDMRVFVRAYRALVARGETEVSLGASARPVKAVPLRAFAEMRYTDAPFATEWRPSAFVITELPPQRLPARLTWEAYGQAGWVGGKFGTAFADGQMTLAREVANLPVTDRPPVRLSVGAGAWGGAQRDANRVDVGPHMRLEWQMGSVPARLSVDWRERVSGDAAPESGVAATLSTSF